MIKLWNLYNTNNYTDNFVFADTELNAIKAFFKDRRILDISAAQYTKGIVYTIEYIPDVIYKIHVSEIVPTQGMVL